MRSPKAVRWKFPGKKVSHLSCWGFVHCVCSICFDHQSADFYSETETPRIKEGKEERDGQSN